MARAKFEAIEEDIKTLNAQMAGDKEKADKIDRLAKVLGDQKLAEFDVDMDDQDFDAVRRADAAITENIAKLIHGLDAITQGFSTDFSEMTQETVSEKLVGFFSRKKSEAMKADRVREASIDTSLNELIRKSDTIGGILNQQLNILSERQIKVSEGQKNVNAQYEEVATSRSKLEETISTLQGEFETLQGKAAEAVGPELAALETQVSETANRLNEANEELQKQTAVQQSLSLYRQQYGNYMESLAKQIAAQKTMIDKLKLDTEQRSILYKTLTESIKASQQQELAHQIDETGRKTDDMADTLMQQIGASSQNRIATMFERHKEYEKTMQSKAALRESANEKFAKRFSAVLADIDNRYVEAE